jgi:electron transfer flavoprotein beta subunit
LLFETSSWRKEAEVNIVVFVKRVPDTESKIKVDQAQKRIVEEGLNFILNPYDEYALEEALRLKEAKGGKVTALCLGPEEGLIILRKCLAMGADEAILVKDPSPERYDGLRTARVLAKAVQAKTPGADLYFFGKQSVGADNSQVPAMTAELLGLPQVNVVVKLQVEGNRGTAVREIEGGEEKVEFSLPAVLSAQKGLNEPRYETLKGIMAAKKVQIPVVPVEELGLKPEELETGLDITALDSPPVRKAGRTLAGTPEEAARELVRLLRSEAKIL